MSIHPQARAPGTHSPAALSTPSAIKKVWHPTTLVLLLSLWLSTVGNLPLWLAMGRLPELQTSRAALGAVGLAVVLAAVLFATLALLVWPRWIKPVGLLLLVTATASSYFMLTYGIVIDPTMVANMANTDVREARDLLSPLMGLALLVGVALPGVWLWRQNVRPLAVRAWLPRQTGAALLGLLVAVVVLGLTFQDLASLMRNNKSLRYMINPYNSVYAIGRHSVGQVSRAQQPLQTIGTDARMVHLTGAAQESPLIIVVVGETARAANFGLGGYARDTTPRLKALQKQGNLAYFEQTESCGTNTETSVPCMFSHLDRPAYTATTGRYESLLDVLQRAGMDVLWLDNQSGCKGVCDRVPTVEVRTLQFPELCNAGECQDVAMLRALQTTPAKSRPSPNGTVVVMHQMGSHGPAYYKRSPPELKAFLPECTSNNLPDCPQQAIVNAYDNSLRATDAMLADTIAWLQTQSRPSMLLYVSDHGESLGEKGLYLHGMPYSFAPKEQTHVPMLTWMSPAFVSHLKLDMPCLQQQTQKPWSHDNLFHTVLDLAGVETQVFAPDKSILTGCISHPA